MHYFQWFLAFNSWHCFLDPLQGPKNSGAALHELVSLDSAPKITTERNSKKEPSYRSAASSGVAAALWQVAVPKSIHAVRIRANGSEAP